MKKNRKYFNKHENLKMYSVNSDFYTFSPAKFLYPVYPVLKK